MSTSTTATTKPARRHMQFMISAAIGLAALAAALVMQAPLAYSIGANVFFFAYVVLVIMLMPKLTADYLSRNARATDQPVLVIFAVTLVVVCVAVGVLFQIINEKGVDTKSLVFALASIPLGWLTIHAMTALHYAHVYWMDDEGAGRGQGKDAQGGKKPVGGFDFPGTKRPQGWDFLYFAVVIGMTAQTSDTAVTTTQMRRIVLLHSVVSFFFNTVIVAAAVNLAVSLGS